ncbi:hypothetical protein [Butyrivibrio sp. FC2001]|uniref:hypothetical protein n=1 Tax=Butyrivibrio sp. FC2001 TaxID=1280671 RepID=UPI000413B780|nr:hypothetical protein [Butyrivibrio sp. FC2001]
MKKRTTTNYFIDHAAKEVLITNKFAKAAAQINSEEFSILMKIRTSCPDYTIKKRTIDSSSKKKTYKGLNLDAMKNFLKDDEEGMKLFNKVKIAADGKYPIIKKWFLDNYGEEYLNQIENLKKSDKDDNSDDTDNEEVSAVA